MKTCGRICVILIFVLLTILGLVSIGIASAKTVYVPDDYAKIQWAVDNASTGYTIIVRDGIYNENLDITKSLTIKSENGSENCIVKAENSDDHIFEVTADYVNISGFTVKGATGHGHFAGMNFTGKRNIAGISLRHAGYCNILNNNCSNNGDGISLWHSNKSSMLNNNCSNNEKEGIHISGSFDNTIYLNNFINNTKNAYSVIFFESRNIWNSTEKITYTYNGSTYTNHMGNYWDDYNGSDDNRDGLGDTAYVASLKKIKYEGQTYIFRDETHQ